MPVQIHFNDPNMRILFSKFLTKTDIHHQLTVPTKILQNYPIFAGNCRGFTSIDRNGKIWPFHLAKRRSPQYDKPCIRSSTWHSFVLAKGLRMGDAVVFFTLGDNPAAGIQVRGLRLVPDTNNLLDLEEFA